MAGSDSSLGWTRTHIGTMVKIPKYILIISKHYTYPLLNQGVSDFKSNNFLGLRKTNVLMWVLVQPGPNFKLKVSLSGLKSSHLHAGKSMKHANASCAHIILQLSLTHKVKFVPKPCTNALSLSPMRRERTPKKSTSSLHAIDFLVLPKC
jgi:hypothetical protein